MVLERMKGVLTWTIDRYLGTVVQDVNAEALKMDLLRGSVELTDLALREDVLQNAAGLPLRTTGNIKNVGLNISRNGSIKLAIEGVHVTVSPLDGDAARTVRLREIKSEEIRRCIQAALEGAAGDETGSSLAAETGAAAPTQGYFAQRISGALLENLQLTIGDVQIVYDHGSAADEPLRLELSLRRLSITEAAAEAQHLQGFPLYQSFTHKTIKCESITAAVKSGVWGSADDEEDDLDDVQVVKSLAVLDVPELSMTASVGNNNAEIIGSLRVPSVKLHCRQPQLRALYLLASQWNRANARAKQAAAQLPEPSPPTASMQRLYIRLHQQQLTSALSEQENQTRLGLEDKISAANIATLRMEAEQLMRDEKAKKASEGWFAWAHRVASSSEPAGQGDYLETEPEPEPEPELELFTKAELGELNLRQLRIRAELFTVDSDAIEDARDSENPKEAMVALVLAAQEAHSAERAALAAQQKPQSSLPSNAAARWTVMWQFSSASIMLEVDPGGAESRLMDGMLRCDDLGEIHLEKFQGTAEKTYRSAEANPGGSLLKLNCTLEAVHVMDNFTTDTRFAAVFSTLLVPRQMRRVVKDGHESQQYRGFLSVKLIQDTGVNDDGCIVPSKLSIVVGSCQIVCNLQFFDELIEMFDATVDPEDSMPTAPTRLRRAESILTGISSDSLRATETTEAGDGSVGDNNDGTRSGTSAGDVSASNSRECYRREWLAEHPAPDNSTCGMDIELVAYKPVVVVPGQLDKPQTMAMVFKADKVQFRSELQLHESEGNLHAVKKRLQAWLGRIDKDKDYQFTCLDAEMPFTTTRVELCQVCMELTNYAGLDSTTIKDVISEDSIATAIPQWDGATPPGDIVLHPTDCSLYVMLREAAQVLSREPMPKFLVLFDLRQPVQLDLTEEVFVGLMGVAHGVLFSDFGLARDAKALERARPPPGGARDTCHYQVFLDAKKIRVNSTVAAKGAGPQSKDTDLVCIAAEDLSLQLSSPRIGTISGFDVRVSMQGLAARDCYSGLADNYLVWVHKTRSRNSGEPVHIDFHAEGTEIDPDSPDALTMDDVDGIKKVLKVDINNSMNVSWVPDTVKEVLRIFNRGVDRLLIPQTDFVHSHSDGGDSPLNSPDRDSFPGHFMSDIDQIPLDSLAVAPSRAGGRGVARSSTGVCVGVGQTSEHLRSVRPRSPTVRPPTLSRFNQSEREETPSKARSALPMSGESRYVLQVAEATFAFEYPVGIPQVETMPSRPLVAVMNVKDSTVDMLWDFNENSQSVDVILNQVALAKSEPECRTDPSISFSGAIEIKYHALLDSLKNDAAVKAGHAFKTVVRVPSLRFVCTPTSAPLVEELYLYLFYSFLDPLTNFDGEAVVDKLAPAESNFMMIDIEIDTPRVLVTGSTSRKGSYFFEAKARALKVSNQLKLKHREEKRPDRNRRRFRGPAEMFTIELKKFVLQHPGSGDVVIAEMDVQTDFAQCFLEPYTWTNMNITLPPLDISLPDSLLKFITVVARDHMQAAADNALRGRYNRYVDTSEPVALFEACLNLPAVTLSYLKDGIRSASWEISELSYMLGSDHGMQSQSLSVSSVSLDAPHQHVLTRILDISWTDESSANPLPEKCISLEGSSTGNIAVRVIVPSSRAVLHADSMMYLKTIIESFEEKEKKDGTAGGLDDIVEEPDSPRAGDRESVMDDWDAPVTLGSRSYGSDGDVSPASQANAATSVNASDRNDATPAKLRTRSFVITAREAELVIPETNRTDLLLFKFGVTAELTEMIGVESRSRVSIQDLSASMGHWDRSLAARADPSRSAEIQLDSTLLRDFETKCEYYRREESVDAVEPTLSVKEKSTVTIDIGYTQVVASADQVFSSMGMVGNLLEELLGDDDEFDDHVFAGDDPTAYEGDGFDDFDGGSLISATTGRSGSKLRPSTRGSHMSSKMSEYSDSDWQTVASESDHGSYALRSRHSAHARSSGGSSDGESESGISQSFHSAENDHQSRAVRDREELFSERLSQYSWDRLSYDHRSNSGSDFSRSKKFNGEGRIIARGHPTASVFGVKVALPSNITIRVGCAFMSLQLTSDPFGQVTPLWQMQVSDVAFAARLNDHDAIDALVTAQFTVQVKYFNLSVLCWESAVEPLLLSVDANHDAQGWAVDLNSERNLNVNVSEALLQALEPLTDTTSSAPNSSAVETAPYRLKNRTGEPIQYTIGTEDSVDATPALLAEGAVADYKIKDARDQRSEDDADFTPRYITFRFEETLTQSVCIDKPGKHLLSLQNKETFASAKKQRGVLRSAASYDTGSIGIFCEVAKGETKGTREIMFGSPVTVNNKANVEIELLVEKPMRTGPHSHATERIAVAPGETQYIPVQFTRPNSGAALRVRPIEYGHESFWSQTTFNLRGASSTVQTQSEADGEGQRIDMVCSYEDQTRSQFCISAAMQVHSQGDPDTEQRVITLYPKLVINNLLPTALDYRFIDTTGTQVMELSDETNTKLMGIMLDGNGNIEPNDSCTAFLHIESFSDWLFQIKIGDHDQWSQQVSVKPGAQRVTVLNDDSREPLELIIYGSMSNHASMELSISCPYWIINNTEDELMTRPYLNSLARKQKTRRRRIEEKVTRLYQDYTSAFSCETKHFSVRVRGYGWSHGISLQTVGTTDFYLSTADDDADDSRGYEDGMMIDDDLASPHGSDLMSDDFDDIEQGRSGRRYTDSRDLETPIFTSKRGCHLGVNITTGSGPLSQTKIFTFTPFFRMDNQTGEDLLVRQRFSADIMELRADMHGQAFQWSDMRATKRVQVKFAGSDEWGWSGGIDIAHHTGEFFVPLSKVRARKATKLRTHDYIIRGEVKNTEQGQHSMRMVVFNKEDGKFPPYLLLNACNESINVRQVGTDRIVVVQPGIVRPYACEEPFSAHRIEFWVGEPGHAPSLSLRLMGEQAVDVRATQVVVANRGGMQSTAEHKLLRVNVDCNGPVAKIRIEQVQAKDDSVVAVGAPTFEVERAYESDIQTESAVGDHGENGDNDTGAMARQFSRQAIAGGVRRRGKDLLSGMKDVALETRGFVVKGFAQGGSVSKIARIGNDTNNVEVLNVGMRFSSVRISFIGAVRTTKQAMDRSVGDRSASSTTAASETVRSEILLVVLDDVRMKVVTNDGQHQAELAVRYAQIDNQSHKTKFPVLLSIAAEENGKDCMTIHVDRSDFNDRIEYFDYAAVQIQDEIHVQLEEEWLVETQSFLKGLQDQLLSKILQTKGEQQPTTAGLSGLLSTRRNEEDELFGDGQKATKNLYFDVLRLDPVRVKLDVIGGMTTVNAGADQKQGIRLPSVSNLQIRFTELQEKSPYGSALHIVTDLIYAHYRRQFMRKIYKVLGGYLQGAQRGLAVNLWRGVYDCVRMPIIMTRKQVELMQAGKLEALYFVGPLRGVIRGTTILVSNTVLGVTEFSTDVVSFFAAFFMKIVYGERTYKLRRRNLMRSRPRHVFDGILLALLVIATALLSAAYVFSKPFWEPFVNDDQHTQITLRMWVEDLFQGIIGACLKPIVGILDGLIMLLNGIGATVGVFGTNKTRTESARKRQPRLFDVDGQLRPVNLEESECQNVLTQLGFTNEVFIDKVRLQEHMVIVTSERLIWYLWDEKRQTQASRAQKFAYRSFLVVGGISIGVYSAIELHYDADRNEERKDMKFLAAGALGIALVFLLARLASIVKAQWRSPWKVGKVLFQSNFLWQVSWKNVEAIALDLPEELREAIGLRGGSETPRWRHSMRATTTLGAKTSLPPAGGSSSGSVGPSGNSKDFASSTVGETLAHAAWRMQVEHENQGQPDCRWTGSAVQGQTTASGSEPSPVPTIPGSPPASPNSATTDSPDNPVSESKPDADAYDHDQFAASDVWAAATEKAKSKHRSAKELKAHMPRLRFRLRQYEKYPRLNVSTTGAVTNFMGLSLQATNPANFMWDTIYKRSERQITAIEENAMGLLRLYDSLASLKERHHFQSGGRTPGPLAAVLENVQFTDHVDAFENDASRQEWAWTPAVSGSTALRTPPSNVYPRDSLSSRSHSGQGERSNAVASMSGLAHSPRGHSRTPPASPLRKPTGSDKMLAQHTNPLATAAVTLGSVGNHWQQPQTLRTGLHDDSLPADRADSFGVDPVELDSTLGEAARRTRMDRAFGASGSDDTADVTREHGGAVDDNKSSVHENPLAAAGGAASFESEAQQGQAAPLFNLPSLMSNEYGEDMQGNSTTGHRYDDLEVEDDGAVQGTPRQAPLFMAAVVDDDDRTGFDECVGGVDGSARTSSSARDDSDGSMLPRARIGTGSEAVFEQEMQLPIQSQARAAERVPAQDSAIKRDLQRSTTSQGSEIESEMV